MLQATDRDLHHPTGHNLRTIVQSTKVTAEKAGFAARDFLGDSLVASITSKLLKKKDAESQFHVRVNEVTDDSDVWVVEVKGNLHPPGRAMPVDAEGRVKPVTLTAGVFIVDAETGEVLSADLTP